MLPPTAATTPRFAAREVQRVNNAVGVDLILSAPVATPYVLPPINVIVDTVVHVLTGLYTIVLAIHVIRQWRKDK
jgi:hypothetical protein